MSDKHSEDEPDWERIRAGQRELDEHRKNHFLRQADKLGVPLTALPWDEHPGLNLSYRSPDGVNEVHLRWLGDGWRMSEVGAPGTYDRSWRYGHDGFERMVLALDVWHGARDSEPVGWLKRDGSNPEPLLLDDPDAPLVEIVLNGQASKIRWAVLNNERVFVTVNGIPVVRITATGVPGGRWSLARVTCGR